ncbi:hypothetical protein NBRGN_004_00820 [Nocardia brasiliensis NBRC 14402]|uniref:alpha/beta fold hydrolase n=1 Tax=Nocardia brasiliensis TaxID=37326 RepID=UPI00045C68B1|nr:alpha/beta hydrolase [Nocardia brasiliensis]GAJ79219.1 hypothetical protein NBRGN_004_00820 [Nocardia brasiliensis NBRC 14402]
MAHHRRCAHPARSPVIAAANPLRGLHHDAEYLRTLLATTPGPITLVGHSYGGAVISEAATGLDHITALVYIAAFAPDEGESAGQLDEKFGGRAQQISQARPLPGPAPLNGRRTSNSASSRPTTATPSPLTPTPRPLRSWPPPNVLSRWPRCSNRPGPGLEDAAQLLRRLYPRPNDSH